MRRFTQFDAGLVAGMLLMLAARGGNWLITPASHPDSTSLDSWLTVAGMVVCVTVAVVLMRKHRNVSGLS